MMGQTSHPQKTGGIVAVPCILILGYIAIFMSLDRRRDTSWWSGWLRHCGTSRKIAASIPDGVTGILL